MPTTTSKAVVTFLASLSLLQVFGTVLAADSIQPTVASTTLLSLQAGWQNPARTYKPHTRWWWPGNALTRADITWQLEQMAAQGIGGVEIMSAWKMYDRGNVEYLTPAFLALVKHAVAEAKRLDLEVAITFSPGWSFGGSWVPQEDQSKVLCMGTLDLAGDSAFDGKLPQPDNRPMTGKAKRPGQARAKAKRAEPAAAVDEPARLVAVVACRLGEKKRLEVDSLTVLTDLVKPGADTIAWQVPAGRWRLMAFWLKFTGQECQAQSAKPPAGVIDHLNQTAVQRYCDYLGSVFDGAVGGEFGKTIDSFFCDSFEIHPLPNSLLWSTDTLAEFKQQVGYDLTPYLPAIWHDLGPLTPRVRYDLGNYLHHLGLTTVFKTFNDWCDAHHVQARIQPHYRFTEELVQGAGATARPETEVTTGRYEIQFSMPADRLLPGSRLTLDLGQVGNIAEVALNGHAVGVAWMAPHRLDITRAIHAGSNKLIVQVTNTLINYVTGLKSPSEVPARLQPRLGKANPAVYPNSRLASREMSETDLPPSGLIGPVQIIWQAAE